MATAAPCCKSALAEASRLWPNRNRASDGIMGDPAHQKRKSDHNLGNAFDLTHDPSRGVDCNRLAEIARHDPRSTYVIWNRRIANKTIAGNAWRSYGGSNPHTKHMHVSIRADQRGNTAPWWGDAPAPEEEDEMTPEQDARLKQVEARQEGLIRQVDGLVRLVQELHNKIDATHSGE